MAFGRLSASPPGTRAGRPMHEINVTPLVDVMLVLLVIFIVAAPLVASRLMLALPEAAGAETGAAPAVLALAVEADGSVSLDGRPLAPAEVRERLEAAAREAVARAPDTELQLRADRSVPYGRVAELIGWAQAAGLARVGLVTQPSAEAAAR